MIGLECRERVACRPTIRVALSRPPAPARRKFLASLPARTLYTPNRPPITKIR